MTSLKMDVINCWNIVGALQSPIYMILAKYTLVIVINSVLGMSDGHILTYSYASVRSIFDLTFACTTSLPIAAWSGKGVTSLTVLSFHWHTSNAVHNIPSFFGICRRGVEIKGIIA